MRRCRLKEMQEAEFLEAQITDEANRQRLLEEEKDKQLAEARQRQESEQREKAEQEARQWKSAAVGLEPALGDPTACEIAFRLHSGKRLLRRFPKTHTVQV